MNPIVQLVKTSLFKIHINEPVLLAFQFQAIGIGSQRNGFRVSFFKLKIKKRFVHMEPAGDDNQGAVFIAKLGKACKCL